MQSDKCLSFYLSNGSVKGHFCRLGDSITNSLQLHEYPEKVNTLLAEMAAISQCFSMDVKSNSHTTMQLTGTAPVKLALVNSTDCQFFRCCATMSKESPANLNDLSIPQLFGQNGKLVFTIDFENQYYQTIVELSASTLQECFQHYFIQSMQIPTIVILCSSVIDNKIESAALLLQKMPSPSSAESAEAADSDIWHEASCFAATIKSHELLGSGMPMERLIELVFGELNPVVSRETILSFKCNCSHEKILNIIKNLDSTNEDDPSNLPLGVVCEYCNKKYAIDKSEIDS
jgi:molecular chaperone Hsp33